MNVAIYLRTSTTEQHPEKQLADCQTYCKDKGFEVFPDDIHIEKLSGFQDIKRPHYDAIKQKARMGKIKAVVVWALDRWVRNRDTLLEDITLLNHYGCQLHSVKESWLDAINIDGPIGKTLREFILGLIGSLAEMESQRKSERTRMAYTQRKGRWGRRPLPERAMQEILVYNAQGKAIRWIVNNVTYYDRNKNIHHPSIGAVHKIIMQHKRENVTLSTSS